jgi:glycosyltransferase involved in cell wall biosynthesis
MDINGPPSQTKLETPGGQTASHGARLRIAVILPCYNEAEAVGACVAEFRQTLPEAAIYVYDNASSDDTAARARAAGAVVRSEPLKGKGNVVRRMFADIDADVYVLADGDATYDASAAPAMIALLESERLDMVVGVRRPVAQSAYRPGHKFGNRLLTGLVSRIFGRRFTDILSGYRVMSRRFVKSFPALSRGFEIETELTVHALEVRIPVAEFPTDYRARPEGTASKLRTYSDGFRILRLIIHLTREERPLPFYGGFAAFFLIVAAGLAVPVLMDFMRTGLVTRQPTWIASVALFLAALQCMGVGLVLDTVTRGRQEMKRLAYLAQVR